MTRSSSINKIAFLFVIVLLSSRPGTSFTISLAPLLTARLGLGPWGNNYVNNFSSEAPSTRSSDTTVKQPLSERKKKAVVVKRPSSSSAFKFDIEDIRILSGCKSECLELIYAKSMDRGFVSA